MTVSDIRASATRGVPLGVRMRGVAYDDLQATSSCQDPTRGPTCYGWALAVDVAQCNVLMGSTTRGTKPPVMPLSKLVGSKAQLFNFAGESWSCSGLEKVLDSMTEEYQNQKITQEQTSVRLTWVSYRHS